MPPRKKGSAHETATQRNTDATPSGRKRKHSSLKGTTRPAKKTRTRKESGESEDDTTEFDSDNLDASDSDSGGRKQTRKSSVSTPKRTKTKRKSKGQDAQDEEEEELELEEGQEVVGKVVKAPTTGLAPPGQISCNTLSFLSKLKDPACNDRQWFKLHGNICLFFDRPGAKAGRNPQSSEPVYRVAEKEWKDFIEAFTDVLINVDADIPPLPPKDVIHRIYRDVRFSNDKTPYTTGFSASFSRSGRKGIFAGYHVAVISGNESFIAAGSWCPAKNELDTIRANIKRDSSRLRQIISSPEFELHFGEARPHPKGEKQNIFGREDELKTAPKGVPKDHEEIDLLKCRSFAVFFRFTDDEVLHPDFKDRVGMVARIMQPLVHCLNDMMTLTPVDDDQNGDSDE